MISQTGQTNDCNFEKNNSSLLLKPSPKFTNLVNQFNNNTIHNINIADNFIHSTYFDIDETQKLKILKKEKCLSLFHINGCSLSINACSLNTHLIAMPALKKLININ